MGTSSSSSAEKDSNGRSRRGSSGSTTNNQTLQQLREECLELGIDFPESATREELIELINIRKKRPSLWKLATESYDELVNAIIRPPRAEYSLTALGRKAFKVDGITHERQDLEIVNKRGLKLQCSWWRPKDSKGGRIAITPCCVYLHGNSSCRAECLEALPAILGSRMTLFAFDFAGSGLSDGDYVSLGYYEREDLEVVVNYLRDSKRVSTIGLWGRSMGAVTALLFVDRDPSISCIICDSPFSSLKTLARELVDTAQLNVPKFAVGLGLRMVRSSVRSRAHFDINDLEPIANASKCFVPALFAAAENDAFIRPNHAEAISEAYAGDKNIVKFAGDHNSRRPEFFIDSCIIFMYNAMVHDGTSVAQASSSHDVNVGASEYHMPAPMQSPGQTARPQGFAESAQHSFEEEVFVDAVQEEDEDDEAYQQLLRHAVMLSLADNNAQANHQ